MPRLPLLRRHRQVTSRLWSLKSQLEIPLSHVLGAEADPEAASERPKRLRLPASYVPGVITSDSFSWNGDRCSGTYAIRSRGSSCGSKTNGARGS
jgi:hypothetical protein